jgi:Recombination endonuclease VII
MIVSMGSCRKTKVSSPCTVEGCERSQVARGICAMHFHRLSRNGTLEIVRPADWGMRQKHPEYRYWALTKRGGRTPEWEDFWRFLADVGTRPSLDHKFVRPKKTAPWGPKNFEWLPPMGSLERMERSNEANRRRSKASGHYRYQRPSNLKRLFGITQEQYDEMLASQGGVCAICGNLDPGRNLAVDHVHDDTKAVRGLLCSNCNSGLGFFGDSVERLFAAIQYLSRRQKQRVS